MISSKKLAEQQPWIAAAGMLGALCLFGVMSMAPLPAHARSAARADVLDNCTWNRPGVDPYMGDVVAAVDRYTDIAPQVREQLKERMRARQYDEIVVISRDAIRGKGNYNARISDMHFGPGRVCRNVTRAGWSEQMQERGLVYCVQGQCILVPTVCRNVSRITQAPASAPPAAGGAVPGAGAPVAAAPAAPAEAGVPVIDNPDALRGGSFTGDAVPPAVASIPFLPFDYVRTAGNVPAPAGFGGGGGGGGGGQPPGPTGSSTISPPTVILPSLPPTGPNVLPAVPEPQTWAMLLAGLALVGYSALRRRAARAA
ncbi:MULTISPECIES: MHFG family PEP-CTERM protein [unclassified Janthinobacterium]|uniref:MHFG family PEP-CTERM protein n=1 Tax=unclassified Janthinobacterium TaxID=2610881 RepID=UPI00088BBB20|nr:MULTISPECIES: MHFG family PEP-CTERM protein [unclassified Janthinobacterium]SDA44970.1 PEP-CTERM protein-sorting domain-containing protein [Janthinobacterium sp. 551a]SFA95269.1 PEP-CTERM protein-sorting domain-containing protein [Janthinobacterium sp. 344]